MNELVPTKAATYAVKVTSNAVRIVFFDAWGVEIGRFAESIPLASAPARPAMTNAIAGASIGRGVR